MQVLLREALEIETLEFSLINIICFFVHVGSAIYLDKVLRTTIVVPGATIRDLPTDLNR